MKLNLSVCALLAINYWDSCIASSWEDSSNHDTKINRLRYQEVISEDKNWKHDGHYAVRGLKVQDDVVDKSKGKIREKERSQDDDRDNDDICDEKVTALEEKLAACKADASSSLSSSSKDKNDCLRSDVPPLETSPTIKLSTAQNALVYDYYSQNYFEKILPPLGPKQTVTYASSAYGTLELRTHVATMLSQSLSSTVDATYLYGMAGTTATLDGLMHILQETGRDDNDALTAAPFWPGFRWATENLKTGKLLTFAPSNRDTMQITLGDVKDAIAAHPTARFLFICNPHNPTGAIYEPTYLEEIYAYILEDVPHMHIISDEMYAHSILPGYRETKYVSALRLNAYRQATLEQQERVHFVWGFAKDFGFNGFKIGFIYSKNPKVRSQLTGSDPEFESLSFISSPISALTDYYVTGFMKTKAPKGKNKPLWDEGIAVYRTNLGRSNNLVKKRLDQMTIAYFPYNYGAQFFWIDLREHVNNIADGDESKFTALLQDKGLALGPGLNYGADEPGYYRLCYTCYSSDIVLQGLDILEEVLTNSKRSDLQNLDVAKALEIFSSSYVP